MVVVLNTEQKLLGFSAFRKKKTKLVLDRMSRALKKEIFTHLYAKLGLHRYLMVAVGIQDGSTSY
eukprot:SAG11_NODE_17300_length_522_cov_1.047281_1_plen_65_part_00